MISYGRGATAILIVAASGLALLATKMLFLSEWQLLPAVLRSSMKPETVAPSQQNGARFVPNTSAVPLSRPFSVFTLALSEIPLALPLDWVEPQYNVRAMPTNWAKDSLLHVRQSEPAYIFIVNANLRLPPRSTHFEIPAFHQFVISHVAIGAAEWNLRFQKAEMDQRWTDRTADEDGFWHWKTREFVLINSSHPRPLDQPLVVSCSRSARPNQNGEQDCSVGLYWTPSVHVRYDFFDTDYPKSRWGELDQRVLALLDFLDGRKPWPPTH
jgi:hypothetical protein